MTPKIPSVVPPSGKCDSYWLHRSSRTCKAADILHIEKTRPGKDLNTFSLSHKVDGVVRGRYDYSHRAHASMLTAPHTMYEIRIRMSTFSAFVKQEYDDMKHGVIWLAMVANN